MKVLISVLLLVSLFGCAEITAVRKAIGEWTSISGETAHGDAVWYACSASRMDAIVKKYDTHPKFSDYMEFCGYGHLLNPASPPQ